MTREEMIKELSKITVVATPTVATMDMGLEYDYITSEGAGTSFGSMGYWPVYKFKAIKEEQWKTIRRKIKDQTVTEQDFDGTDLGSIIKELHEIYGDFYNEYYRYLTNTFENLLTLPETLAGPFFCLLDIRNWGDVPDFYIDKKVLEGEFCERYCLDVTEWKDMDDEEIQNWFERLETDLSSLEIIDYTEEDECKTRAEEDVEMTRTEMLEKLHTVEFQYIWPGNWEDIGFTEREIWVRAEGYGYLWCDEPSTASWSGSGLTDEEWIMIKKKLEDDTLVYEDIKDTCLVEILEEVYGYESDDDEDLRRVLDGLLDLPKAPTEELYAMCGDCELIFFVSKEAFKSIYERDWVNYKWEELEDDILKLWIERLFEGERDD